MEELFNGNIVLIFFFAMVAIYNYSDLKEYQRIAIIYITVYSLTIINVITVKMALTLLAITMFCFLEILTLDETKFKILANPFYKLIDCMYLSFSQYGFFEMIIAIILCKKNFVYIFPWGKIVFLGLSAILFIIAITIILQQKFVVNTFSDMYKLFVTYPINRVEFNDKLNEACNILISIEDKYYFDRKGYTFFSLDILNRILKEKLAIYNRLGKIKYVCQISKRFIGNVVSENRGYSTIPMQLIRSLGIKRGYNYKYRRKIFELIYSRLFFDGIKRMFEEDQVARRSYIKQYFLYIYFHKVNTFLGNAKFSKFLNAFDMQYSRENKKDIYDVSNEGIFIACMGLSKRADSINRSNIDYYLSLIHGVELDGNIICEMVDKMMSKPYAGNYLK